jgi:hypothetical protein
MAILTEPKITSGKREDLADLISLVDSRDTPFTSMAKKGSKPGNTHFRWQVDQLPSVKSGGVVDGTDVDVTTDVENYVKDTVNGTTKQYRHELSMHPQMFRRTVRVSPMSLDLTNIAGVKDELANNVAKSIKMLKRDIEVTLCGSQGVQQDNGTVPYLTRGLDRYLAVRGATATNILGGGVGANPSQFGTVAQDTYFAVPTDFQMPKEQFIYGTVGNDLTEENIQNLLTGLYEQTGTSKEYDALVGTRCKRGFTNLVFTTGSSGSTETRNAVRTFNRNAEDSTYTSTVQVFEGDFGRLKLHSSTWLKNKFVGYVIPFDMVEVRYGGQVAQVRELPDFGGGPARTVEAVLGLVVHNPLAFGKLDFTA